MSIDNAVHRKAAQEAALDFLAELAQLNTLMAEKAKRRKDIFAPEPPGLKRARGRVRRASHTLSEALVDLRRYQ